MREPEPEDEVLGKAYDARLMGRLWAFTRPHMRLVLATFIEFGLYILLLPPLGFRIATFLFVLSLQVTLEWPRSSKHWLLAIAVAAATSLICYLVFQNYLSLLLPRGTWSNM